ncbi:hypothetical protein MPTK1_8g09540 [Marchantia polymorpha subsp. ruderalis]|uniref:Uncharacterized protein n=1 Tax=Marchantia polymorpha TaxID=3197 RepID=A0A2R6XN47_MARPO|nr:hypothetical protein MARPO_0008s0276 [Marchantia polymorpha]BBN19308.1 hypothetical protein Mp_8g09540 [Marchantia polymorpha subsp. ruderalis]|eukprot:PTQ47535.1 hypothetical protein MARPO_0008s0276 [Marchantia polymorpha]
MECFRFPASDSCGRMRVTDPNPSCLKTMPIRRNMGDMVNGPAAHPKRADHQWHPVLRDSQFCTIRILLKVFLVWFQASDCYGSLLQSKLSIGPKTNTFKIGFVFREILKAVGEGGKSK